MPTDACLFFLRLPRLRRPAQAQARRLLRAPLPGRRAVPTGAGEQGMLPVKNRPARRGMSRDPTRIRSCAQSHAFCCAPAASSFSRSAGWCSAARWPAGDTVPTGSMQPTIRIVDRIVVDRMMYRAWWHCRSTRPGTARLDRSGGTCHCNRRHMLGRGAHAAAQAPCAQANEMVGPSTAAKARVMITPATSNDGRRPTAKPVGEASGGLA